MTKRAFITGATGFVGRALAERLAADGWQLVALARSGSEVTGLNNLGIAVVRGDLNEPASYRQALEGCSVAFHCAGLTGVGRKSKDYYLANLQGTQQLLNAVVAAGVEKVVYISSIVVYDVASAGRPCDESQPLLTSSVEPYGKSKMAAEAACLDAARSRGINVSIVRPGFIYGPGDRPGGFLPELAAMLQKGKFRLIDGGEAPIPLIYIADLVDLLTACGQSDRPGGEIYNACAPETITWCELVQKICEGCQLRMPGSASSKMLYPIACLMEAASKLNLIDSLPLSKAAVKLLSVPSKFSAEKAVRELGWRAGVSFDQGIARCMPMLRELLG